MRVAALVAVVLPVFVAAQISCDASSTALCCFDSEDPTPDSFTQLSALPDLQGAQLPVDSTAQIGLLCTAYDSTCTDTPMCCTDNSFNGVAAFGCVAQALPTTDSTTSTDSTTTDTSSAAPDASSADATTTTDSTTTSS